MNFDANPNVELQNLGPICLTFSSYLSVGFGETQKLDDVKKAEGP
jgi:hypothetical protein